ncbi:MAG: LptF/LptG family permease [Spirochaetaceae bacterium]
MRLLSRMVLRQFVPVLLVTLVFFVLVLQLVDLFGNLVRYLDLQVPPTAVARVQLLYVPKAVSFALPISVLFAAAYTLGTLYSNNELIAVLASGIPLRRLVLPLVVSGLLLSLGSFGFEETVVIETYTRKTRLTQELLNVNRSFSNTDVTLFGGTNRVIYHADYYNDATRTLSDLTVLLRQEDGSLGRRIDAEQAEWRDGRWVLRDAVVYRRDAGGSVKRVYRELLDDAELTAAPETFRRRTQDIEEMRLSEAADYVRQLRRAGLPYREALTSYYERFSFALTPFVVTLIAGIVGSRFKKNILLMSLLVSLSLSVVYYIVGMVTGLLAATGTIPPWAGAWSGFFLFLLFSMIGYRHART